MSNDFFLLNQIIFIVQVYEALNLCIFKENPLFFLFYFQLFFYRPYVTLSEMRVQVCHWYSRPGVFATVSQQLQLLESFHHEKTNRKIKNL